MKTIKIKILSWLLHHANRTDSSKEFYTVKNKILSKYGKHLCYDIQFIEGKKCYSCDGTGLYTKYTYAGIIRETCYNCYGGWYKRPTWNVLSKMKFGNYYFHQPFVRLYKKPEIQNTLIDGYIDHKRSKYGDFAAFVLLFIYEHGYLKRWYKKTGIGWKSY